MKRVYWVNVVVKVKVTCYNYDRVKANPIVITKLAKEAVGMNSILTTVGGMIRAESITSKILKES